MQLYGVKTPELAVTSKRIEFGSKGLNFSALVSTARVFSRNVNHSCRNIALRVTCEAGRVELLERKDIETFKLNTSEKKLTCVMKFGGSSVASAERMKQVAKLILSFPDEKPVVVLSAMAKTTNMLLMVNKTELIFGHLFSSVILKLGDVAFTRLERRLFAAVSPTSTPLKS